MEFVLCGKKVHGITASFSNPMNPDNRLGLSAKNVVKTGNGRHSNGSNSDKDGKQQTGIGMDKKSKAHSAQAKTKIAKDLSKT